MKLRLRGLIDYDISNFKLPSMFLIFPHCSFKCDKENNNKICQNSDLIKEPIIEVRDTELIMRYVKNPLIKALVCGGLEPFDSWEELFTFIIYFRGFKDDPIVIYTGYKEEEIQDYIKLLQKCKNIIVKFGRFIPNSPHIFDPILGVELASNNQYAVGFNCDEYILDNGGENKNG